MLSGELRNYQLPTNACTTYGINDPLALQLQSRLKSMRSAQHVKFPARHPTEKMSFARLGWLLNRSNYGSIDTTTTSVKLKLVKVMLQINLIFIQIVVGGCVWCVSHSIANAQMRRAHPARLIKVNTLRKNVSVTDLVKLSFFVPARIPFGFHEKLARIAWVSRDPFFPNLPARRAAWIRYVSRRGYWIEIIECVHQPSISSHDNVNAVLSEGYFRKNLPDGCHMYFHTTHGVDLLLLSQHLELGALARLAAN